MQAESKQACNPSRWKFPLARVGANFEQETTFFVRNPVLIINYVNYTTGSKWLGFCFKHFIYILLDTRSTFFFFCRQYNQDYILSQLPVLEDFITILLLQDHVGVTLISLSRHTSIKCLTFHEVLKTPLNKLMITVKLCHQYTNSGLNYKCHWTLQFQSNVYCSLFLQAVSTGIINRWSHLSVLQSFTHLYHIDRSLQRMHFLNLEINDSQCTEAKHLPWALTNPKSNCRAEQVRNDLNEGPPSR